MAMTAEQMEQQKKQAEELLFAGPQKLGFAKSLFFGQFDAPLVFPYPELRPEERAEVERAVAEVRQFAEEKIDAMAIDRKADLPQEVIDGLGRLGVLGMTAPKEFGGRGFSQMGYCKVLEVIGSRCASTAIFVNAHHSIGIRALILFGTEEQKRRWMSPLCNGEQIGAFALTEPEAGSDAANVQTTATPSPDGKTYILNGEKRYITNGGFAKMLTVMARTPVPGSNETKITAFLVTPDMPGFEVTEHSMPKCGVRGSATARLAFHDMAVPSENILGGLGKGLRVALTVLDFGRTTFGATCTGAAKTCLKASLEYAKKRVQFKQPIGEFELVKKKLAYMTAHAFAMEATTTQCASFIDRGAEDYMLETAILKVFASESLWTIVNDTVQIYGGQGYVSTQPYERMMRDARINLIGEGANDVLKAFIALVGLRGPGEQLKGVKDAISSPLKNTGTLWNFVRGQVGSRLTTPEVPVRSASLHAEARELGKRVRDFGLGVQSALMQYREAILERQYIQERIADAACDLYASSCALSRLDQLYAGGDHSAETTRLITAGKYFLKLADRRIRLNLAALSDNDDAMTTATADALLKG